ncbi:MAG: MBL fold metallo-hydrolase [Pseudomonadales bacterium]|nr:MBL fold metallo-hydrolase [Pseudomonadales bacterium]
MLKRREFVKSATCSALALGLPLSLRAQSTPLHSMELAPGLSLVTGAGCNVVVAVGSDAVAVVDGGLREQAPALLQKINELAAGKPVRTLFNSNWRPEHIGLNYLLGGSGLTIIAHENTRLWQTAEFRVEWEKRIYEPLPEMAQANQSFYTKGSLDLGSEVLDYGYLPQAHTDGDIYIYFRRANVLAVSDLLGATAYPILDYSTGGWIGGMQKATAALLDLADDNTRIIAAEGPLQSRRDLEEQAVMLDKAREQVAQAYRSGYSLAQFKASEPASDFGSRWGDPELFLTQLYEGAWGHVRELGRII